MFRMLLTLLCVSVFAFPSSAQEPPKAKGRKVAFLVGVGEYAGSGLNPIKQAEHQVKIIESGLQVVNYPNEDVITLTNSQALTKNKFALRPSAANILTELKKVCKTLQPEDQLIIVYTGHCGVVKKFRDKGLMLLPLDVRLGDEETMISLNNLFEVLDKQCKSQSKMIFLAPCRSNMIDLETNRDRIDSAFCPPLPTPPKSIYLISACEALEQSTEDRDGNVPFFSALVEGMAGLAVFSKGKVEGADLLNHLKRSIPSDSDTQFFKGDKKAFESIVFLDGISKRKTSWSETGSVDRRVLFEKNEPSAVLLTAQRDKEPIRYWVRNPVDRKDIFASLGDDATAQMAGFSADGSKFFVATSSPALLIYETKTGKLIQKIGPDNFQVLRKTALVKKAVFSGDGEQLLCCDSSGRAFIWSIKDRKIIFRTERMARIPDGCLAFSSLVVILISDDARISAWSTVSGQKLWEKQLPSEGVCLDISPEGTHVAVGCLGGELFLCSSLTGEKIHSEDIKIRTIFSVNFSHDGKQLVACGSDKEAIVWDVAAKRIDFKPEHERIVECAAFSHDGSRLASGSRDRTIKIWDTKTGKCLQKIEHDSWVMNIVFSPDGKKLVTIDHFWESAVWDVETGKRLDKVVEKKPAEKKKD